MAPQREPPKASRRTREDPPAPPVGAQAQASAQVPENTIAEEPPGVTARAQRERAGQEPQNVIRAVQTQGTSKANQTEKRAVEERSNTDPNPRVMPEHINIRYARVGDDYRFPDGNLAFRDQGERLSTKLENNEVIRDLIAIAQTRGWSIEIAGTKEFRRRAWQEAQLAGVTVAHYEPTELERQQLARRMSRERGPTPGPQPPPVPPPSQTELPERTADAQNEPARRDPHPVDRVYRGRLIDHGVDRYQFDPRQEESYYVILDTPQGEELIWGKDLQRAIDQSLSRVREGQDVVVRHKAAKPVTVNRPVRDEQGQVVTQTRVKTHLNSWSVETEEFVRERAKLAEVVRDVGIDAKTAVTQHPELAGTYGDLHAARLVALQQNYKHPADIERFVNRTREAIAQEIEKGDPLSAPLTRARFQGQPPTSPRAQQRAQERAL
jgi:hypothetical protein